MQIRAVPGGLEVWAPAKLNLFLEVLARRADGFHELETLFYPIDLYDTLFLREHAGGEVRFACRNAGHRAGGLPGNRQTAAADAIPLDGRNTVVRALELLRQRAGVQHGIQVELVKRIPAQAGLGGGSSDAAAALVGANRLWRLNWTAAQLHQVAAEVGSDVPFFLGRGPAVGRGRGELLEPVAGLMPLECVVVRPPVGLATAEVFRNCRPAADPRRVQPLVAALRRGAWPQIAACLWNGLEQAAVALEPWLARLRAELSRLDVCGHLMSGSGSSWFAICRHAQQARRLARYLEVRGVGRSYAVRGCP